MLVGTTASRSPGPSWKNDGEKSTRSPVFWIRMIGVWPPADSPAAMENASPSRLIGTSRSEGSAGMS